MKRGRVIVVGVIVVVVAAAVTLTLAALLRPREPTYQGKSLSEWVDLLYTPNHTQAMNSIAGRQSRSFSKKRGVGILLFKEFIGRFGRSFLQSCNSVFPLSNRWT